MTRLIDANVLKDKIRNWSATTGCHDFTTFDLYSFINACDCADINKVTKTTIKDYASMPEVLIDGKVFVDREIFREYALNLLQQELDADISQNEDIGLRVAMSVIRNIR